MMRTRNLFLVLVSSLALATACAADTPDPSLNNSTQQPPVSSNNSPSNNTQNPTNNTTPSNNTPNPSNNTPSNNTPNNNNPNTNNHAQPADCTVNRVFSGQIGGTGDHDGGVFTTDALTHDAGLEALFNMIDPAGNNDDDQVFDTDIEVRGATVTTTSFDAFASRRFWVQDSKAGMQFYLTEDAADKIKVGQIVNFDAVSVGVFNGHPQVTAVSNFEVVSEGNPVPVVDFDAEEVTMDHYYKNIRISGKLGPNINECGGSNKCYDIIYGDNGNKSVMLRSSSNLLEAGKCVTFVGPVGAFPGPKNPDGNQPVPQLETVNFNWLYSPRL